MIEERSYGCLAFIAGAVSMAIALAIWACWR